MKKYLFVITFIFLSGCMVGPNYKKPNIELPTKFLESKEDDNAISSLTSWWDSFDDPILNDLIKTAISNNYSLKIALEKIEETRAYYRIKKANLFPEIDLNAAAARSGNSKNLIMTSFLPDTTYNLFQIGFDALWEIDIFGKIRREKEAAIYELQSSQESMRDVYVMLISDVARYYVDVCSIQNIIILTSKKIELQKNICTLAEDRNAVGIENSINENVQFATLKQLEESLLFYDTLLKDKAYHLAALLGQYPDTIIEKIDQFIKIPEATGKIKVGMPSTLLRKRPDIRIAERKLAVATAKTGAAIAEYFPVFSLTGAVALDSNKLSNMISGNSFQWSLGSLLKWPILTFGRVRANVDAKKSQTKQALFSYENIIVGALQDVESALTAYYNEGMRLNDIQEEKIAYLKIAYLENNKYQNGIINLSNAINAEKTGIDAMIKEIESKRVLAHNLIALYKALGGSDW